MDSPLVSIIIPIYNVSLYLTKCVQSVCAQTYSNLEIILVDDGSTDASGHLCDRFARQDARVQVLHQKNSGVSAARNAGLEVAKGRYIYFADGDDWVMETMVEDTMPVMERGGYDLCAWGMNIVQDGQEDIYFGRWKESLFQFSAQAKKQQFLCRWVLPCRIGWSIYCRAFRRDIIERFALQFDTEYTIFEDLDFLFRYLACCQNMYYIPKSLYAYRQHSASAMHTNSMEKQLACMLQMVRRQEHILSDCPLFQPFFPYSGTALSVLLWNFTRPGEEEQGLLQAIHSLEHTENWTYLQEQARVARRNQTRIRRMCGWRLGGQVNGFYQYVLTGNPRAYCRANWFQHCFLLFRKWKNKVLHHNGGRA